MYKRLLLLAAFAFLVLSRTAAAQPESPYLTPLNNQIYDGIGQYYLMTDGTVLGQDNFNPAVFWKLTPDIHGSYINGSWSQIPDLNYAPYAFSGAVLADGRLLVEGGEYTGLYENFTLTAQGAIYSPYTNEWSNVNPPAGWINIGDSPNTVLTNGNFLIGQKLTEAMAVLNPATMTWTPVVARGKSDFNAEEGWTLLPNGFVMTADVQNAPNTELFNPRSNQWISAGNTPSDLHSPSPFGCSPYPPSYNCYFPPGEIGPAILRPDGTVFFTGSYADNDTNTSGHTAIYNYKTGKWSAGPDFPYFEGIYGDNAGDEWGVLLPNGNVFVEGSNTGWGYEFNGTNLALTTPTSTFLNALILLPTGEVLTGGAPYAGYPISVYTSTGTYESSWQPVIGGISSTTLDKGNTYRIWGQQFNGLSQACAFGDEDQCATNYPLVRVTNNETGHVFYLRTHNHSSMGVATGTSPVWTYFDVPYNVEFGPSSLVVVANGIPSAPISVSIGGGCAVSIAHPEC
jgi:hypothetical protein